MTPQLAASTTAFLGLLSPVVAILLGWVIAGENLTPMQIAGIVIVIVIVIVLSSISAAIISRHAKPSCCGDADLCSQQIHI
ncbi:EamA family transporter [Cryobacterium lyxosi]|nr:EamA family transporter [Cryobacterium lyxosi]